MRRTLTVPTAILTAWFSSPHAAVGLNLRWLAVGVQPHQPSGSPKGPGPFCALGLWPLQTVIPLAHDGGCLSVYGRTVRA